MKTEAQKLAIETFFKNSFCAQSAKILEHRNYHLSITGAVEIDCGDGRGVIHVALVKATKKLNCDNNGPSL